MLFHTDMHGSVAGVAEKKVQIKTGHVLCIVAKKNKNQNAFFLISFKTFQMKISII